MPFSFWYPSRHVEGHALVVISIPEGSTNLPFQQVGVGRLEAVEMGRREGRRKAFLHTNDVHAGIFIVPRHLVTFPVAV